MPSSNDLVLVTGATGFVGSSVALAFLEKGFRVRGTARSADKAAEWDDKHAEYKARMEWAFVKDIVAPGAFDTAIQGVTILAHVASPFHMQIKDNLRDMLLPAISGTREALLAAKKTPSVKRVVVTSSFAAIVNLMQKDNGVGITYSETDWNPATLEQATASTNPGFTYCASKALAEREAWNIAEGASFALTVLCPPMIFGPHQNVIKSMASLHTSAGAVWSCVDAQENQQTEFPVWVSVEDIASLHVRAATEDVAKGQRYLCAAGHFDNSQIASIIRKAFPEQAHRIPDVAATSIPHYEINSSKAQKDFGITWRSFEECIVDTAAALFALEKSVA